MADVYFKKTTTTTYFTNEPGKTGYKLRTVEDHAKANEYNPTWRRTVVIELYNDAFILPEDSNHMFVNIENTSLDTTK